MIRVGLVARASDSRAEKVDSFPGLCSYARHFIMLASPVAMNVNGCPVGRIWHRQCFQPLNLSFTFLKILLITRFLRLQEGSNIETHYIACRPRLRTQNGLRALCYRHPTERVHCVKGEAILPVVIQTGWREVRDVGSDGRLGPDCQAVDFQFDIFTCRALRGDCGIFTFGLYTETQQFHICHSLLCLMYWCTW